jgi:hypothetical protein
MNHLTTLTAAAAMPLLCLGAALTAGNATAQEKQRVSFKTIAENSKYTQQLFIDVGDTPGHQVRVYELHRTFPSNPPVINGVKLVETWTRATSDYTDGNGTNTGYTVWVLESGDKFFARQNAVAQKSVSGKSNATSVSSITGGTGKFAGIRGLVRQVVTIDPKAGFNQSQCDIEYWMEK